MIRLKTAVLLATALKMGSYIAGASTEQQEMLYEFGINIGLAFQIQDDILDVWGNPETFGKAVGGDISCNKKTFVALTAMQLADTDTRTALEQWFAQTLTDNTEKIAAVKALYEQVGTRTLCEETVEQYTAQALHLLDQLPQNPATEQLRQLANKLNARKN
jgi:geranylgeranyl diphosphate synthase type II